MLGTFGEAHLLLISTLTLCFTLIQYSHIVAAAGYYSGDLNSNVFKARKVKFGTKWKQCLLSYFQLPLLKIWSKCCYLYDVIHNWLSTEDLQLTPTLCWAFSCMRFIWTAPCCQHSGWLGGWVGAVCGAGVCTLFVDWEKLFSWDASGRFACIKDTEGKSNPFLSSKATISMPADAETNTYTMKN